MTAHFNARPSTLGGPSTFGPKMLISKNPEKTEEIVLSGYNTITWKDERLKWDTEKYDGQGVYQNYFSSVLIGLFGFRTWMNTLVQTW